MDEKNENISKEKETEIKANTPENQATQQKAPLDTETTFADMNVEGFSWYNPRKKKGKGDKIKVSRKEYWAMVRGAFSAMLPMILCMFCAFGIVIALAYLWLKP